MTKSKTFVKISLRDKLFVIINTYNYLVNPQKNYVNVLMYQCTNVPMYQCTNVSMYQCTNVSMCQCINYLMYQLVNWLIATFSH